MKMQQTKSYWRVVLVAGVVSAFVGAACTVTTSTDDGGNLGDAGDGNVAGSPGTAGAAGSGHAGSSAAGSSGAGTAGSATAGSGGAAATPFVCDPAEAGATGNPDANACEMVAGQNDCDKCVRSKCCTEYANCYATDPGNQCGYGGPNNDGEFFCYNSCLVDVFNKNGSIEDKDKGTCAANCATSKSLMGSQECGSVLGTATNELIGCVVDKGCEMDCYGG